jgi:hypothetical protein
MPLPREIKQRELPVPRQVKRREIKSRTGLSPEELQAEYEKRKAAGSDLQGLNFDEINARLGPPSEVYRSKKRPNLGLAIWATGDDKYTVVGFLESIDGSNQTVVLTVHEKRTRSIVANMKNSLDSALK